MAHLKQLTYQRLHSGYWSKIFEDNMQGVITVRSYSILMLQE